MKLGPSENPWGEIELVGFSAFGTYSKFFWERLKKCGKTACVILRVDTSCLEMNDLVCFVAGSPRWSTALFLQYNANEY